MGTVSPQQSQAGETIEASDINTPINQLAAEFNGGIDDDNIEAVSGTKVTAGTLPGTSFDATLKQGWLALGVAPNTVTCNGNRSYDLVFNSVDLSDSELSPGMRLRLTRTVTAPTQCTDLEASSSQYFNDTSVSGMTFTDDFTVSAWVKLEGYAAMVVGSRYNGTSGWECQIDASGRLLLIGYNGGAANFRFGTSYQSLPLNKWVHIAATLDMSGNASTMYFDGASVPTFMTAGGTNPTALIQAGNLEIGAKNGGTNTFDGKIAQFAVYSAIISAANIRATISQGLSGSETSLISAYSFNNSINDLNANANNLTAQGSAVATNADSPFALGADLASGYTDGTTDFAVITAVAFSTNTTVTVQVPEGCTIPTSGGVSAVSYSTQKAPYGFPSDSGKWRLSSLLRTSGVTTSNASYGAFLSGGWALTTPVGGWNVGWQASLYCGAAVEMYFNISSTALTGLTVTTGYDASPFATRIFGTVAGIESPAHIQQPQNITSASTYVMYTLGATASAAVSGSVGLSEIFAEFKLL